MKDASHVFGAHPRPPWMHLRGKLMISSVKCHKNATIMWDLPLGYLQGGGG